MKTKPKFGVGISTGMEGLMVNMPYASAREVVEMSVFAEKIGFDSVWGNDHIHAQKYVRDYYGKIPRSYSPLLVLTAIAERTTRLEVCTGLLVAPFRNPSVVAKELVTLDCLSNGRLKVGIGLGAYREEFDAMYGSKAEQMARGKMLDESLEIMTRLFTEEQVSYKGEYFETDNIISYPKPIQNPFPFYIGGNSDKAYARVAKYGTGWLPALLTTDELKVGRELLSEELEKHGRDIKEIDVAPQLGICCKKTHEEAEKVFLNSQLYRHAVSLSQSTMKGKDVTNYQARNIVGDVDEVKERINEYLEAGVTHFSAMVFVDDTLEEAKESMQFFAEEIMPSFR